MQSESAKKGVFTKKYMLPSASLICSEETLADVFVSWNEEGLFFLTTLLKKHSIKTIELFIDTRDVKTSGYNTRFCHHFLYDFTEKEPVAREVTHFRGADKHTLIEEGFLFVKKLSSNDIHIIVSKDVLFGYEPMQFDRIGFSYRISFETGAYQHFAASSTDYKIEEEPSLWASCKLKK